MEGRTRGQAVMCITSALQVAVQRHVNNVAYPFCKAEIDGYPRHHNLELCYTQEQARIRGWCRSSPMRAIRCNHHTPHEATPHLYLSMLSVKCSIYPLRAIAYRCGQHIPP